MKTPTTPVPLNEQQFGSPTDPANCASCGGKLPQGKTVYCSRRCAARDKE